MSSSFDMLVHARFWNTFDTLTSDTARINFMDTLLNIRHPYDLESQPDAVIQRFYFGTFICASNPEVTVIRTQDSALNASMIAEMFIRCFGANILCFEASICEGKYMTIVDCLEADKANASFAPERIDQLIEAFKTVGVMPARMLDQKVLEFLYWQKNAEGRPLKRTADATMQTEPDNKRPKQ